MGAPSGAQVTAWTDGIAARVKAEIDAMAGACRFRDCSHTNEPGCAVLAAIETGSLGAERLESAHKLSRELAYQQRRQDVAVRSAERKQAKSASRALDAALRRKGRVEY